MQNSNRGALSPNQYKKSQGHPDWKGKIVLEVDLVKQLLNEAENGQVTLRMSGWNKSGSYGEFISVSYDSYKPDPNKSNQYAQQAQRQAPAPQQQPAVDDEDLPF